MVKGDLIYFHKGEFFEVIEDEEIPEGHWTNKSLEGGELITFSEITWGDLNRWRLDD